MSKRTYSSDKDGHIVQINDTEKKSNGTTVTTHSEPLGSGLSRITGKTVHHPDGDAEHYEKHGPYWKKSK